MTKHWSLDVSICGSIAAAAAAALPPSTRGVLETSPHVMIGEAETPSRPGANKGVMTTRRSCSRRCRFCRACRS
jgi:radical SAM superfamily enzyme YgiQ (UPF0313 family)